MRSDAVDGNGSGAARGNPPVQMDSGRSAGDEAPVPGDALTDASATDENAAPADAQAREGAERTNAARRDARGKRVRIRLQ